MKNGKERWYADYVENGSRVREVVKDAQGRGEAILHLQQRVSEAFANARGLERSKAHVRFSEFADCYIRDYAKTNKRSWENDLSCLRANLIPEFGNLSLTEITAQLIEKYRAKRLDAKIAKSSVNREMALLKKMYSLAIDWGFAHLNPVKKIKFFSEKDNLKERILKKDEEARLLTTCVAHLQPVLIVALNTGMRLGEILGMKWCQVDLRRLQIRVERTKSGSIRHIPINEKLSSILGALKAKVGVGEFVFPNDKTGRPLTTVKRGFMTACRKAGIKDLRFHDLRHTFASRLVEGGADLITVKELLGHSSVKITERYTHPSQSLKRSAVESLAQKPPQEAESLKTLSHICHTEEKASREIAITTLLSIS
jgi:integrase